MEQVQLNNEVKKRVNGEICCAWCGGVISGKAVRMNDGSVFHDEDCAIGYYEDKFQNSILDDNLFYFGYIWEYHLSEFQRAKIMRDLEVIEVIND